MQKSKENKKMINVIGLGYKLIYFNLISEEERVEDVCNKYILPNYNGRKLYIKKTTEQEKNIIKNPYGVESISLQTDNKKTIFILNHFNSGFIDYTIKELDNWKTNTAKPSQILKELYSNLTRIAINIKTKL